VDGTATTKFESLGGTEYGDHGDAYWWTDMSGCMSQGLKYRDT
jgi:hypothetical protein